MPENTYILNIKEFNNFYKFQRDYDTKKTTRTKYCNACKNMLKWYINYCNDILDKRIFGNEQLIPHLFRLNIKTVHQFKEFLRKSIFVSKMYVEHLHLKITPKTINRYKHTLTSLFIDLEFLIDNYEQEVKKTIHDVVSARGRYPYLRPRDILYSANTIFFIEEVPDFADLYLRDIKPVVILQIRQLLEMFGKNLLGYSNITNTKGELIKKFTQEAWKFIQIECKKPASRISLPFNVDLILQMNNWSNSFVHTTYIYSNYIQFYALQFLKVLFKGDGKKVKTYDGNSVTKFNVANIRITNYLSLKNDFELHLLSQTPDVRVNWIKVEQVGAYIISL
jgi:hypothetical protein